MPGSRYGSASTTDSSGHRYSSMVLASSRLPNGIAALEQSGVFSARTVNRLWSLLCSYDTTGLSRDLCSLWQLCALVSDQGPWIFIETELLNRTSDTIDIERSMRGLKLAPLRTKILSAVANSQRTDSDEWSVIYRETTEEIEICCHGQIVSKVSLPGMLSTLAYYSFLLDYLDQSSASELLSCEILAIDSSDKLRSASSKLQRVVYTHLKRDLLSVHHVAVYRSISAFLHETMGEDGDDWQYEHVIDDDLIWKYWESQVGVSLFQTAARHLLYFRHAAIVARGARALESAAHLDDVEYGVGEDDIEQGPDYESELSSWVQLIVLDRTLRTIKLVKMTEQEEFRLLYRTSGPVDDSDALRMDGLGTCIFPEGHPVVGFEGTCWRVYAFSFLEASGGRSASSDDIPDLVGRLARLAGKLNDRCLACAYVLFTLKHAELNRLLPYILSQPVLQSLGQYIRQAQSEHLSNDNDEGDQPDQANATVDCFDPTIADVLSTSIKAWKTAFSKVNQAGFRPADLSSLASAHAIEEAIFFAYGQGGELCYLSASELEQLSARLHRICIDGERCRDDFRRWESIKSTKSAI